MVSPNQIGQADNAIERFLRRADALIQCSDPAGRQAAKELLQTLVDADQSIARRLDYWVKRRLGGGDMRFSEASLLVFREQVQTAITLVQDRLLGITNAQTLRAARMGLELSTDLFNQLEQAFVGVVRPLQLDEAMIMHMEPSLLMQNATSVDRYGKAMIADMERALAQGFAEGVTQSQMVDRLVKMKGPRGMVSLRAVEVQPNVVVRLQEKLIPEGLFVRRRSWAWRIVRTETANAQNAGHQAAIRHAEQTLHIEIKRKILAVMDMRTAPDSIEVHGQVRAQDEMFVDGAGRTYLRPPARPNDRETIIPWRDEYPDTPRSRPLTERQRTIMTNRNVAYQKDRAKRRRRIMRMRERQAERRSARADETA